MLSRRRGDNGREVLTIDEQGGVFTPNAAKGVTTPIYAFGFGHVKAPVFTCPVSAIPDHVWTLMDLWLECRAFKAMPKAGGVSDQPWIVRRAFPLFEAAYEPFERARTEGGQLAAMQTMLAAIGLIRLR